MDLRAQTLHVKESNALIVSHDEDGELIFTTREGNLEKAWQHLKLRKREMKVAEKEYKRIRALAFYIDEPVLTDDE